MLTISETPNKDGMWSVRDENGERVALFYDDGLAREMVACFNTAHADPHKVCEPMYLFENGKTVCSICGRDITPTS